MRHKAKAARLFLRIYASLTVKKLTSGSFVPGHHVQYIRVVTSPISIFFILEDTLTGESNLEILISILSLILMKEDASSVTERKGKHREERIASQRSDMRLLVTLSLPRFRRRSVLASDFRQKNRLIASSGPYHIIINLSLYIIPMSDEAIYSSKIYAISIGLFKDLRIMQ